MRSGHSVCRCLDRHDLDRCVDIACVDIAQAALYIKLYTVVVLDAFVYVHVCQSGI